jgi:hypothetical protein
MKRRELLTLAVTVPVVTPAPTALGSLITKLELNSLYGRFGGDRVLYMDTDGVVTWDINSAYPESITNGY